MDVSLFKEINKWAVSTPALHGVFLVIAVWLGVVILAVLFVIAYVRARFLSEAPERVARLVWIPIGSLVALGVGQLLNHAVARPRPWQFVPGALILAGHPHDYSFPSDHGIVAGAIVMGIWLAKDSLIAGIATVFALFLGFTRVYVGAHYPLDVLGGLFIGAVVIAILSPLAFKVFNPMARKLAQGKLRWIITSRPKVEQTVTRFSRYS